MSEWISVKDRLPEKNGKYFVTEKYGDDRCGWQDRYVCIENFALNLGEVRDDRENEVFNESTPGWFSIYWNVENDNLEFSNITSVVTHWQELPEPASDGETTKEKG